MLPITDMDRCTLPSFAVAVLASLRSAAASGSGSLSFFADVVDVELVCVGDVEVACVGGVEVACVGGVDTAVDEGVTAEDEATDDDGSDSVEVGEQPATRAAAALTTVRTAGGLRMPVIVEGAPGKR